MSTALGIAAVTHVLKDLLNDGLIDQNVAHVINSNVLVTSVSPGIVDTNSNNTSSQLNLFLYRVSPNTGWSNMGFPSRNAQGTVINNPPLALNLHYLLTAFGEDELHSEILLGYGMQLLHENPVLSRDAIRFSLTPAEITGGTLPSHLRELSNAGIAEQIEQIKITHESINTEEMSRLWTAFQTRYRPGTAYMVTVLLIESTRSTRAALPVRTPRVFAVPFKNPIIEKILSQAPGSSNNPIVENRRIEIGDRLFIRGTQLKSDGVLVQINGEDFVPNPDEITDTEIQLVVPNSLRAGLQGIQINQPINLSLPNIIEENTGGDLDFIEQANQQRKGASSNLEAFVLSPSITIADTTVTPLPIDTGNPPTYNVDIELNLVPGLQQGQRVILFLNQINPATGETPAAYSHLLASNVLAEIITPLATVNFSLTNIVEGDYLVRIQVDGAESPIIRDMDGTILNPIINVTT